MLRKLIFPLVAAFALTGCVSTIGPADYSADADPESGYWNEDYQHSAQPVEEPSTEGVGSEDVGV